MKYYVYSKYMESGTENFVGVYDDYKSLKIFKISIDKLNII